MVSTNLRHGGQGGTGGFRGDGYLGLQEGHDPTCISSYFLLLVLVNILGLTF